MDSRSFQSGSRDLSSFISLLAQPKQPCKIPSVSWGTFFLAFPTLDQFNSILAVAVIEHSPYPDVFHTELGRVGLSSSPQASPPAQPLGGI